ncbi:ribosomal RNA processing protein 1 homolog A [Xenopus tropicalis]|uniref:Novel nuclear protein 1 n=1 Tax=Xenopus tropicalis TaxID=8364 RepID=Q28CG7_XENTR|nr:ribosomal RNA processing protein 1 homolog A [Xenopus tropicalis]CAJ83555.1 Novel nuclear protein 1 [Xenopus tropicalis]|eukprot:NP_001015923.1 ribosomal RNA processing protein 1 homolog A [Xenopus tropicalis]
MASQDAAVLLAQRLAGNDKKTRDRALRKLRNYLRVRSASDSGGFTEEEFIKIWKGLFYCMWMQDKPLLQEALAQSMSQLVHTLHTQESQNLFLRTFWQTLSREWNGIDRLRLDKFYTLMRMVLRESVELLKKAEWEESSVQEFLALLNEEVLKGATLGVQLHLIDIYLEEVAKVGAAELTAEMNLKLIEPFCKIVAKSKNYSFLQAVTSGIFQTILEQAPFAIEDLMKEIDSNPEGKEGGSAGEESGEKSESEDKESQEQDNEDIGPVLQFDYQAVADRLFALGSRKNLPTRNRKAAYALVKKFRDLAEGIFPSEDFPEEVSTDEDDDDYSSWLFRKRMKRAQENGSYGIVSRLSDGNAVKEKKREKRKRVGVAPDESKLKNDPPAAKRKRKRRKTDENNNTPSQEQAPQPSQNGVAQSCCTENHNEQKGSPQPAPTPSPDCTPTLSKKPPGKRRRAGLIRTSLRILPLTGSLLRRRQLRLLRSKCKISQQPMGSSTPEPEERPLAPRKEVTSTPQNFMSFQKANSPKPVYVKPAKARGRQVPTKMGSKSKKVTFSLNKNMTAEFKRTDRSLLVSPTGSSRVAFNPEQRPDHGVLKTPTSSPAPRARAADFF